MVADRTPLALGLGQRDGLFALPGSQQPPDCPSANLAFARRVSSARFRMSCRVSFILMVRWYETTSRKLYWNMQYLYLTTCIAIPRRCKKEKNNEQEKGFRGCISELVCLVFGVWCLKKIIKKNDYTGINCNSQCSTWGDVMLSIFN